MAVLGLTVVASLGGRLIFGLIGAALGLFIATIGIDPLTGTSRFTFGNLNLTEGVGLIPVIVGLFAVSEVMKRTLDHKSHQPLKKVKVKIFDLPILRQIGMTLSRSSIIGVVIGILPGIGASTAAMVSYSETVRWSKHPEKFGKGAPEGIAAPESANNAAAMVHWCRFLHWASRQRHHGRYLRCVYHARFTAWANVHADQQRFDLRCFCRAVYRQLHDSAFLKAVHRAVYQVAECTLFRTRPYHYHVLHRGYLFGAQLHV